MKFIIILSFGWIFLAAITVASPTIAVPVNFKDYVAISKPTSGGRITNGEDAAENQFPYQGHLTIPAANATYFCGCSLISSTAALTAAHCLVNAKNATAYFGSIDRTRHEVIRVASEIFIHPNYNSKTLDFDAAVIRWSVPIQFNEKVQPIKLPTQIYPTYKYFGKLTIVSGWGLTTDVIIPSTNLPIILQFAKLTLISTGKASIFYGTAVANNNKLFADTSNLKSTCSGDSGGPLVLDEQRVLIGITSFGASIGCERMYPVGFTFIEVIRNWLQPFLN